ncbi:MAG: ketose-bisphosphate aldolase [Arachnia sp.]
MLVNGKDLLGVANTHNFAIPAFNIADYHMFNGVMDLCEARRAPVIIAIHPNEIALLGMTMMETIRARAFASSVPVTINWDHGASYEEMIQAIHGGFTSVMIDASTKPFDENVALTKRVVDTAHVVNVSVEGELGTIGSTDLQAEAGTEDIIYTDPVDAVRFVEETGVDLLAIAIGTRHGIYPAHLKPELKLDLLKEIKAAVSIPLVLHGGSNNPDEEIAEAARLGINKINISSDMKVAYFTKMREVLADTSLREPDLIVPPCIEAMQVVVDHKLELFGTVGRADLY